MRFDVFAATGEFMMTATEEVVRLAFNLHRDALARVQRETADGADCVLHFNGRIYLNQTKVTVRRER